MIYESFDIRPLRGLDAEGEEVEEYQHATEFEQIEDHDGMQRPLCWGLYGTEAGGFPTHIADVHEVEQGAELVKMLFQSMKAINMLYDLANSATSDRLQLHKLVKGVPEKNHFAEEAKKLLKEIINP